MIPIYLTCSLAISWRLVVPPTAFNALELNYKRIPPHTIDSDSTNSWTKVIAQLTLNHNQILYSKPLFVSLFDALQKERPPFFLCFLSGASFSNYSLLNGALELITMSEPITPLWSQFLHRPTFNGCHELSDSFYGVGSMLQCVAAVGTRDRSRLLLLESQDHFTSHLFPNLTGFTTKWPQEVTEWINIKQQIVSDEKSNAYWCQDSRSVGPFKISNKLHTRYMLGRCWINGNLWEQFSRCSIATSVFDNHYLWGSNCIRLILIVDKAGI